MPAVCLTPTDAADLADLLWCLRQWIDADQDQLDPLLDTHDYDLTGLLVSLDRYTALLTSSGDDKPSF